MSMPAADRKRFLRGLQVQWHPDRQYDSAAQRELADEISRIVNEAARVAKEQAALVRSKKERTEAFDNLQRYLNRGGSLAPSQVSELKGAIERARVAGVSEGEITKAESLLQRVSP
mmetsp:Transcript_4241/g.13024  ORF Transcript_4241/g.13024 Transcript_4241/m.13024 type:complete len:116 (-) Transcript_4241:42-389(-)